MSKNKKSRQSSAKTEATALRDNSLSMHEKFANLFVLSMFTVFPVFMTDMLFNVRKDRLHYFVASTFVLLFFLIATYICMIDKEKWPKKIYKMTVTDWAMIGFLAVCGLSSLFSKYGMESVTGEKGRDSGLLLMAMYVLCYFLITRYYKCKEFVFHVFTVTACVVCLIAVLHHFYVDPFKILERIKEEQQETFITTIGNKNLFSCFVCVAMPIMAVYLVRAKDIAMTVFYSIAVGISFMGLLVATSDSGYFGLAAFMLVLFVYACGNFDRMFRYSLSIFAILLSGKVLRLISLIFDDKMKTIDTIPKLLIFDNRLYILIGAFAIITVVLYFCKKKYGETPSPKWVQRVATGFVVLCGLAVLIPFIYFSFIDTTTDLGGLSKYLRLNDKWGTHRGYAWIRSIILFKSNGIKNMLIGSGPDTFGQMMKAVYRQDMLDRHGSVFDSAHNEYLNYLVTVGILGLGAYVTAIGSVLVRGFKRCKDSVPMIAILLVIISYSAQAMFNLAQPITTPYIFLFIAMGEAIIRRSYSEDKEVAEESSNNKAKKKK